MRPESTKEQEAQTHSANEELGLERLVFFSDAVMAIAITLLAIDLRVPTGNLDSKTADAVFALFERLTAEGKTVVMVTHDTGLAQRIPRTVLMADGEMSNATGEGRG